MEARWLLLVVALLQGVLAFSPIPTDELEAEWEAYSATLRDPAYRLPTTTTPSRYAVSLTPYFDNVPTGVTPFTFDGTVAIQIMATEANVSQIVMHCQDLTISSLTVSTTVNGMEVAVVTTGGLPTCEMPYAFLRISTQDVLQQNQVYTVNMAFTGIIQSGMRGFYRSWYRDSTGRRWMGTTQFQPGHARQAFPCYDEPGFKSYFDITIIREADFSPSISNMPIATTQILTSGRVSETFYTTPLTSTYLLAFIVSHYEVVSTSTADAARPFDIYARNNAGTTGDWSLEIGELLLAEMERYTGYPYYTMAPNMNMKQAAIPDFSAGAMENWGLLTYREALILYDPENSNHFYKQRVANIVSHEIAHMWFGNLVTCAWWDNLWLNEGFARFYQYYLTDSVAEELGYATRFIVEQVHTVMFSDSVDTAHALTNPNVNNPTEVSNHFSAITYARGAAVLRMTQHLLGEETYVAGLRRYLQDRSFDVAEPHHLFEALDAAAAADGALDAYPGITIDGYFRTWSEKAGHPLLTVVVDQVTGAITVVQARWERNTGVSSQPSLWQVPISWTRGGAPDFEDLKPSRVLTEQITVLDRGTSGLEWVIFNKQESGFYRVNYDRNNWALITRALRSNERTVIHELNRAQIVDDVFALARAGVMDYARALNIISFLEFEDQYAPWLAAISGFQFLIRRTVHDAENSQKLKDEIIRLSSAVTNRLGYADADSDTYMDGLLRMYVMEFLCNIGHEQCVQNAVTNFQNWRTNGTYIHPNMRSWVFCAGLREGSVEDFNYLWEYHLNVDVASDRLVMLQSLGCTRHQASLEFLMSEIVTDNENIRPQDYTTAMSNAVSGNEENTQIIWNWLKTGDNLANSTTAFGSVLTPLSYIAARLITEAEIIEFETWLAANQAVIGTAYDSLLSSAQASRNNLAWSAQRLPEMRSYLDVGYVDDVVELPIETPPVETPPVEPDSPVTEGPDSSPDSANIVALSLITLLVTVGINVAL